MQDQKSFLLIVGCAFALVLIFIMVKVVLSAEERRLVRISTESATKQFIDFKRYKDGENAFPIAEFYTPDSRKVTIRDFSGRYVLLNIWATWCPGCVTELPSLEALDQHFRNKNFPVMVVPLSYDRQKTTSEIADYLVQHGIGPFALYHDRDKTMQRFYAVKGMPTTLLIDPDGYILFEFLGSADWIDPNLVEFLENEIEPYAMMGGENN